MARGVNKVILLGNLGRDPEVRYMPSGGAVTSIAIATSQSWKDHQSGEMQTRTEWHNIIFFNRLAEIAGEYLKKGSQVYIEGSLRTRKYTDKNGIERYTTEIIANELQMLGRKTDAQQENHQQGRQQQGSPQQNRYQQGNQSQNTQQQGSYDQSKSRGYKNPPPQNDYGAMTDDYGFDDSFEDDLPF